MNSKILFLVGAALEMLLMAPSAKAEEISPFVRMLAAEGAPAVPATATATEQLVRIELVDAQVIHGTLIRQDEKVVVVRIGSGATLAIDRAGVRDLKLVDGQTDASGRVLGADPANSRYLYAPSGQSLKKGEYYVSQKELLFSTLVYGATDHLALQVGGVVPAWFLEDGEGFNLILGAKYSIDLSPRAQLGLGAQTLLLPIADASGIALANYFASLSAGDRNAHITLAAGGLAQVEDGNVSLGEGAVVTLSAYKRISPRFAVLSENWMVMFNEGSDSLFLGSLAGRIINDHLAVDVGFVLPYSDGEMITEGVPVPWVDFTYRFK